MLFVLHGLPVGLGHDVVGMRLVVGRVMRLIAGHFGDFRCGRILDRLTMAVVLWLWTVELARGNGRGLPRLDA